MTLPGHAPGGRERFLLEELPSAWGGTRQLWEFPGKGSLTEHAISYADCVHRSWSWERISLCNQESRGLETLLESLPVQSEESSGHWKNPDGPMFSFSPWIFQE